MMGYITKDDGRPHYKNIMHNVSEEQIVDGKKMFELLGNTGLKHRVKVMPVNFFDRVFHYYNYSYKGPRQTSLGAIVLDMMRSGKFYPDAKWVTPAIGGGMDYRCATAAFKMMAVPKYTNGGDIMNVFFKPRFGKTPRYFENIMIPDPDPPAPTVEVRWRDPMLNEMELGLEYVPLDVSRSPSVEVFNNVERFVAVDTPGSRFARPGCLDVPLWDDNHDGVDEEDEKISLPGDACTSEDVSEDEEMNTDDEDFIEDDGPAPMGLLDVARAVGSRVRFSSRPMM
jgi:hypothetical protein